MAPARRTEPGPRLPEGLGGPVDVELVRSVAVLPGPSALPGGSRYEPKWDGFRAILIRQGETARIWSRQGKELTHRFPGIVASALLQLPTGVVLDGEVVAFVNGKLDFQALLRGRVGSPPALFMAFDLLALGGVDLRTQRWSVRRTRLDGLASTWSPPLQLSPVTSDVDEAKEWFDVLPAALGVEGLVVKGAASRYVGGRREWLRVKHRESVEAIAGAVTGSLDRPDSLIVGRYRGKTLEIVGRTVKLRDDQAADLSKVLRPAGARHPWPDEISTQWHTSKRTPIIKVRPGVVVEVSADAAQADGHYRHPLRLVRMRPDLSPDDVPNLATPATG
ncbi:ATP-dependent DNA ligase [Kribbella sancticallisti]|uniref:ATP-dependent DNA ligase n=1 Tax=Kribbella sancticallisti TaxID=460087 RepID=UPI0031D30EA8